MTVTVVDVSSLKPAHHVNNKDLADWLLNSLASNPSLFLPDMRERFAECGLDLDNFDYRVELSAFMYNPKVAKNDAYYSSMRIEGGLRNIFERAVDNLVKDRKDAHLLDRITGGKAVKQPADGNRRYLNFHYTSLQLPSWASIPCQDTLMLIYDQAHCA